MKINQKFSIISDLVNDYEDLMVDCKEIETLLANDSNLLHGQINEIENKINDLQDNKKLQKIADDLYEIHGYLEKQMKQFKANKNIEYINNMLEVIKDVKSNFIELFTYRTIMPKYLDEFNCIGPDCPDTCCKGWKITIDKNTNDKYQNFSNKKMQKIVAESIKLMPSEDRDFNSYSYIELDNDDKCPFLTEKGLCGIQLEKDHTYLSYTCATYPRTGINLVNNSLELSAAMSCPEIRRLGLFQERGIEFEIKENFVFKYNIKQSLNINEVSRQDPKKYLPQMRRIMIWLLQNRDYSITKRLIMLGLICNKLNNTVLENEAKKIPSLLNNYQNLFKQGVSEEIFAEFNTVDTTEIKITILNKLLNLKFEAGIDKKYYQVFEKALTSFETDKTSIADNYESYYKSYYQPVMSQNQYILENYLVNYIFKELFPISSDKNIFEEYMMLMINYALIKMLLIGYAGHHQKLNQELIDEVVGAFSRTIEHDPKYLKQVYQFIKDNNYDTLAHMIALIKE